MYKNCATIKHPSRKYVFKTHGKKRVDHDRSTLSQKGHLKIQLMLRRFRFFILHRDAFPYDGRDGCAEQRSCNE